MRSSSVQVRVAIRIGGCFDTGSCMKSLKRIHHFCLSALVACSLVLPVSCASWKNLPPQPVELALAPSSSGIIKEVEQAVLGGKGAKQSAFLLLERNEEALKWRMTLADHATSSIDAQYYIWDSDESASLMFERLMYAADRGVRVRLLLDDFALSAKNKTLAAISRYPNIEIKIFNPAHVRRSSIGSLVEFILYFKELNRRMHNKMFVVDNRFAIVGGRNIGDAYFGLSENYNNSDLDVLATGPVVPEVSSSFDEYWNQSLAVPGSVLSKRGTAEDIDTLRENISASLQEAGEKISSYPIAPKDWSSELRHLPEQMKFGTASFIQDDPLDVDDDLPRLLELVFDDVNPSKEEVRIVSPYFIPGDDFLKEVKHVVDRGIKVKFLTGSLGSNNHTVAHSHYKKYRRRILETGAELYEFRHDPSSEIRGASNVPPVVAKYISLHTKTIVGDRDRCFIGSLNLDPRSVVINTENGMLIDSPDLADELATFVDQLMSPENSWQVYLDEQKRMRWKSSEGVVSRQPARKFSQRIADFIFRLMPIESQL